jgi:hypothetical protein
MLGCAAAMVGIAPFGAPLPLYCRGETFRVVVGKARAQKGAARAIFYFVIAGLDPAIHAAPSKAESCSVGLSLHVSMDHLVKPGGEE